MGEFDLHCSNAIKPFVFLISFQTLSSGHHLSTMVWEPVFHIYNYSTIIDSRQYLREKFLDLTTVGHSPLLPYIFVFPETPPYKGAGG